jgi:3-deoxy-D-manno-octulosonic-acid transferase
VRVILPLYAAAATLGTPALRLMLARRLRRGRERADRLAERWGVDPAPRPPGRLVWLHAASVGETMSVLPVLEALAGAGAQVLITTGTVTSAALLDQRLPALGLEACVRHRFVPLDVPSWAARFLDHWRPDAAGFVESEIWPNLIAACRRRAVPTMLVNARLSPRSFSRWRLLPGLARALFATFERVQAQSEDDAGRLRALGARNVTAPGNLKFAAAELPADPAELARLQALLHGRPVWLAVSTHPGEEAIAAAVHAALVPSHPGLLTMIVPRHPQRGAALAAELTGRASSGPALTRRSLGQDPPAGAGLWIGDTMAELGLFIRLAGPVFVGKSLAGQGGQNPLEPARLGRPVALGPHTANFADAVAALREAGALAEVADAAALAAWVGTMLRDRDRAAAMGRAGIAAAARTASLPGEVAAALLGLVRAGA